jgi:hypothetical protein
MRAALVPKPVPLAAPLDRQLRIEYLGFQNLAQHREFRLRVCWPEGSSEFRLRIAIDAFGASGVRLQDGPDVCYQKLMSVLASGEATLEVITVDQADLTSYREAHTKPARQRSATPPPSPKRASVARPPRTSSPQLPVAPPVAIPDPVFVQGQRVSHPVFGPGVTTSSNAGHTVVQFDGDGPKRFVTSMLEMDVLSAPHTWETGPRGKNRPCRPPGEGAAK